MISDNMERVSIAKFIRAIRKLPSDEPKADAKKWYSTQKEHWLGWLSEYSGPGAYGRKGKEIRNARFAYNHIVEVKMLLWLIESAGVPHGLLRAARRDLTKATSLQQKSATVRKHVPWSVVYNALWENGQSKRRITRALSVQQPFAELIMSGKKKFEYRTKPTSIRERVYIYASKKSGPANRWARSGCEPGSLPTGVLVGTVEVAGCKEASGQYAWKLVRPQRAKRLFKPKNRPQPVWFRPF